MKLFVKDESLVIAVEELKKYVDFDFSFAIEAESTRENGYKITRTQEGVRIDYAEKHTFFMALKALMLGERKAEKTIPVKRIGVMFDCARNAVMNLATAKEYFAYLALIGYSYAKLYVEDCLKVDGEPYFGYMRGSYSKEEIRELDGYAQLFGIELVPCIQTLAHYNQLFLHQEYKSIQDKDDILLIGADRTYELLDNIFRTVAECFSSRNINIGMDEAHYVGRGKYCDCNGYTSKNSLLFQHLEKVLEICKKYGFSPYMWSDMVFTNHFDGKYYVEEGDFSEEYVRSIPEGVTYVYWDYYHMDKALYANMLRLHKQISKRLCFAGGIWTWRGFVPYNEYTEKTMFPALEAAREAGVEDIFFTMWGDNGGECSRFAVFSSLVVMMEKIVNGNVDYEEVSKTTNLITGYTYEDFKALDLPNQLSGNPIETNTNPSKYLLYADPFISFFDDYIHENFEEKYVEYAKKLSALAEKGGKCAYVFETEAALCKALSLKAELSVRLKKAYDEKDKEWLAALAARCDDAAKAVKEFYGAFRRQWTKENKRFGFEISDIRIGGLIMRLSDVKEILLEYVTGKTDGIEELEEERRTLKIGRNPNEVSVMYNNYRETVTAGIL